MEGESVARKEFDTQKKKGAVEEEQARLEIEVMKGRLQALRKKNQNVNFSNYERINETMDEQEVKMLEKQSMLHEHANSLETLIGMLNDPNEPNLKDICPYNELLKITPLKDDFFTWTPTGRPPSARSEHNSARQDRVDKDQKLIRLSPRKQGQQHVD